MDFGASLAMASSLSEQMDEIKAEVEKVRPVVQAGVEILQSFGPEVKTLLSGIVLGLVDVQIAAMQKYQDAGYTKAQSIQLVLGVNAKIRNAASSMAKKS